MVAKTLPIRPSTGDQTSAANPRWPLTRREFQGQKRCAGNPGACSRLLPLPRSLPEFVYQRIHAEHEGGAGGEEPVPAQIRTAVNKSDKEREERDSEGDCRPCPG